jgi:ATP-dependent Clp protease ATP-binding subunit ClpA
VFERFTTAARETVLGAVVVAGELDSPVIGTEHVLVALTADPGAAGRVLRAAGLTGDGLRAELAGRPYSDDTAPGVDRAALSTLGIDYDEVRRAAEQAFGPGALDRRPHRRRGWRRQRSGHRTGHRPFTAEAKRALERSLRESLALRDRHIGAEHLLLGLACDPSSAAGRLLRHHQVDLDALRRSVLADRDRRAG